jgi:ABC-type amino acid transport/signal transduction systems, periplasmic component/domain
MKLFFYVRLLLATVVGASVAHVAVAAEALDEVKRRGELIIGLEGTYPPFNFQDESGKLAGFEVEFANALVEKLGVKAQFRPTKWDGILAALETGRLDVVINQVTVSEERKRKYAFTQPYTISGIQIIARKGTSDIKGPDDLAGKRVGVVLGSNYEQWLRENQPKADVRTYDDDPSRNQDLRTGRIDAILNDRLIVADLVKKSRGAIEAVGEPFAKQEQAIAVRKDSPQLLAALNEAIDALRADGTLTKLSEKWFGADVTR